MPETEPFEWVAHTSVGHQKAERPHGTWNVGPGRRDYADFGYTLAMDEGHTIISLMNLPELPASDPEYWRRGNMKHHFSHDTGRGFTPAEICRMIELAEQNMYEERDPRAIVAEAGFTYNHAFTSGGTDIELWDKPLRSGGFQFVRKTGAEDSVHFSYESGAISHLILYVEASHMSAGSGESVRIPRFFPPAMKNPMAAFTVAGLAIVDLRSKLGPRRAHKTAL